MESSKDVIDVYTDGSCNPQQRTGGWAAILLVGESKNKIVLSGARKETTHQEMELIAALKAIEYIQDLRLADPHISVYSDSQYLVNLPRRKNKLMASGFTTTNNSPVRNKELICRIFNYLDTMSVDFIKVKAHEKTSLHVINLNREADKLSRKIVRDSVRNLRHKLQ